MISFTIKVIDKGKTIRAGQVSADDWDAAMPDLREAEAHLEAGQWIWTDNEQIRSIIIGEQSNG